MSVGALLVAILFACQPQNSNNSEGSELAATDSVLVEEVVTELDTLSASQIGLKEDLLFQDYYLSPTYEYKDTTRCVQLEVIKEKLAYVENLQREVGQWAVVRNYRNMNGEAPTVANYVRNEYKRVSDSLGVERYQSAPLYNLNDSTQPVIYARDGWLMHILDSVGSYYHITPIRAQLGDFWIPRRYIRPLGEGIEFHKVIFVDRTNQNIVTTERSERGKWVIRSTNPATTGKKNPPYMMETPLGVYLVQEKKAKMFYTHDGSSEIAGYAPWASRFTNGAYIHGVPVNGKNAPTREYSASLGTTPRSHMCVRNATSHSKYVYDWAEKDRSLVIVID